MDMKKLIAAALLLILIVSALGCSNPPTRGEVKDGVYTNTYFGLSFKLPEGWKALTDDEFLQKYSQARATNEQLAETKMGFGDGVFYKIADGKTLINLWYDIEYGTETTNEQIKNLLIADMPDYQFGEIGNFKIGEADYSIISAPTADAIYNIYYCWSNEAIGYLRPMIFIRIPNGESVNDLLANFSQISK
jgi:hypothetical protein